MHGALVPPVGPAHEEIRDVDDERVGHGRRDVPGAGGLEDFEAGGGGGEEQGEAFVVGVGAEADLLVFFCFRGGEGGGGAGTGGGRGLFRGRVVQEAGDAAGVRGHGVEVGFGEVQGESEEAEEVAGEVEDLEREVYCEFMFFFYLFTRRVL